MDELATIINHMTQVLRQMNSLSDSLGQALPALEARLEQLEKQSRILIERVELLSQQDEALRSIVDQKLDHLQLGLDHASTERAEGGLSVLRSLLDRNDDIFRQIRNTNLGLAALIVPPDETWSPMFNADDWRAGKRPDVGTPSKVPLRSSVCREEDFATDWFLHWCTRLDIFPQFGRKWWEYAYIVQALWERGALQSGKKGLGFGVGIERLPALFASLGCEVVASDAPPAHAETSGWSESSVQYAAQGLQSLRYDVICEPELFFRNTRFLYLDMNDVPDDFDGQFDFTWSSCALEHLGSLEAGMHFIERSIDCLAPGGLAVHTTEYTLNPLQTVEEGPTVLYRGSDLQELAERLIARGYEVERLDLDPGEGPLDTYVDLPPYRSEPHLKLALEGFVTTSVGVIVRKPSA